MPPVVLSLFLSERKPPHTCPCRYPPSGAGGAPILDQPIFASVACCGMAGGEGLPLARSFSGVRPTAQGKIVLTFVPINGMAFVNGIEVVEDAKIFPFQIYLPNVFSISSCLPERGCGETSSATAPSESASSVILPSKIARPSSPRHPAYRSATWSETWSVRLRRRATLRC